MTESTRLAAAAVLVVLSGSPAPAGSHLDRGAQNTGFTPAVPGQTRAPESRSGVGIAATAIGGPLENPWAVAILPTGDFLVTERPGRMRVVSADGRLGDPIEGVPAVLAEGQGGLLDVTLGPDFASDRMVYFSYSKPVGDGLSATAAARGRLSDDMRRLEGVADIFVQEPPSASTLQYGSRIVFTPDGRLFVTVGERFTEQERGFAQDLTNTYGKVLRLNPDGTAPADNPFAGRGDADPRIWSYGHRNIQGAAIEPATGRLWTLEHGPRGGDELNRPEAGRNYGWPVISYGENYDGTPVGSGRSAQDGMEQPVYYWDPVIAPSGMVFYEGAMFPEWRGDILAGSLTPGALVRIDMENGKVAGEEEFLAGTGLRVRDVAVDPADGSVVIVADETDSPITRITRQD